MDCRPLLSKRIQIAILAMKEAKKMIRKFSALAMLITSIFILTIGVLPDARAQRILVKQPAARPPVDGFVPGEILVKFKPEARPGDIQRLNLGLGTVAKRFSQYTGTWRLTIPEGTTVAEMVTKYTANPLVEYAEPNYYAYATSFPNDPLFGYQWHLDNPTYGGINMKQAWGIEPEPGGTSSVVVAVVDSGVAYEDREGPGFWHRDTYNAYGGTGYSWWCGVESAPTGWFNPTNYPPGYGNGWKQYLQHSFDLTGASGTVTLSYYYKYDIEKDWDYFYVDVSDNDGASWINLKAYTNQPGSGAGTPVDWTQDSVDLTGYIGEIILIRFRFNSDEIYSDEVAVYYGYYVHYDSDGAVYIDEIELTDGSGTLFYDDVEGGPGQWETTQYGRAPDLAGTSFSAAHYDFINDDAYPNDDEGHGTHVTGTVAQTTNNGYGVAGVAFNTTIMPVKVLNAAGTGTYQIIADGIHYAVDEGAHVINLSLGGGSDSPTLKNAVQYAYESGVTVIASSGNSGPGTVLYPAAYDEYVICVGATGYDESLASYSSYYTTTTDPVIRWYVDVTAPGGDGDYWILQETFGDTPVDWGFWFYQGTSMAAPHVSGVAALLLAEGEASTPDTVRAAIQSTAEDKGATGWDAQYGWGIVDAYAALQWTAPTAVIMSAFGAYQDNGRVVVYWETASETGTVGFHLLRLDEAKGKYRRVNGKLLPALPGSSQGGMYRCVDETALTGEAYTYELVEVQHRGKNHTYGPFTVEVERAASGALLEPMVSDYSGKAHEASPAQKARIRSRKAERELHEAQAAEQVGDAVKVAVTEKGLYYLDSSQIASLMDITPPKVSNMIRNDQLALTNRGQAVAYLPDEEDRGIYFYGESIDSIYTRENVYKLGKGKGQTMRVVEGEGPEPASSHQTYTETLHFEEDLMALTALFDDPHADYWLWDLVYSGYDWLSSKTFSFRADGVADTSGMAGLTVHFKGATDTEADPDHHVKVSLNGIEIGESFWNGTEAHSLDLSFHQTLLNDGDNELGVTVLLDTGAPHSAFYVDSFDLRYHRLYQAVDNRLLARGDGNPIVTISGFAGSGIYVFDVTEPEVPAFITATTVDYADGSYRVSFRPASPDSLYLALTLDGLGIPVSVVADVPSNLKGRANRADYLVLTSGELSDAAQDLANYRSLRGARTMVVEIEDIYDEFNYGISSPESIRYFLAYAYYSWGMPPRYVVLAGGGSYDYRDNLGHADNLVPVLMVSTIYGLFASDNRFVDVVDDDGVPEMAIGRIPVLTSAELQEFVGKIKLYESSGGNWVNRVMMLADNPDEAGDFPADSDDIAALLPQEYTAQKIYLSEHTVSEAQQLLFDGISNGALLLNFIGHAGPDRLASEGLLVTEHVSLLSNWDRLPITTAMTCVVGQFSIPGYDSLGETLVLKDGGGAVAVWAPTGLSLNNQAKSLGKGFFQAAFQDREKALGEVVLRAVESYTAQTEGCDSCASSTCIPYIYSLLGDPMLEVR